MPAAGDVDQMHITVAILGRQEIWVKGLGFRAVMVIVMMLIASMMGMVMVAVTVTVIVLGCGDAGVIV